MPLQLAELRPVGQTQVVKMLRSTEAEVKVPRVGSGGSGVFISQTHTSLLHPVHPGAQFLTGTNYQGTLSSPTKLIPEEMKEKVVTNTLKFQL